MASPDSGTTLGAERRSKCVTSIPGTKVAYWLVCMSCEAYFLTSNMSGHVKCYGCRAADCACRECTEWRGVIASLCARGLACFVSKEEPCHPSLD